MTNTKKFEFKSPKDSLAENIKSKEFKNYEFPSFKIKSNCSGSYLLYFNDKVEKIDAGSAYEAMKKTNFKSIDKILYVSENVCMKNIFPSDELITQD